MDDIDKVAIAFVVAAIILMIAVFATTHRQINWCVVSGGRVAAVRCHDDLMTVDPVTGGAFYDTHCDHVCMRNP